MKKTITSVLMAATLLVPFAAGAWAAGDGSGAGKPLEIVSSSISDGETDVPLDREIKFVFSKNIANITVAENNRQCFTMTDSSGNTVPIEVIIFDDQLEREKRNDIVVKPESLREGEQYTIAISPNLQAKSGDKLEKEVKYTFSTVGFDSEAGGESSSPWIYIAVAIVVIAVLAFLLLKRRKHGCC
ncbi:MAG: Ig-like domain-containing protein [Dethiobacteria bacterium]